MSVASGTLRFIAVALPLSITMSASAVDFNTDIIPVLTRAGCNAGACHGAAGGRGEFRLSLFGSDPAADYDSIVEELEGRRVNLAVPQESLLLGKPTGRLPHGGDVRLDQEGEGARLLLTWIAAGAPRGGGRTLTHFEVNPACSIAQRVGDAQALRAFAQFDDGPREDVTRWTVFTTADPASAEIDDEHNTATVLRSGKHVIVARFLDRVAPVELVLPFPGDVVDLDDEPRANFVDDEVFETLALLRLPVASPADDATYLRRVRLDLTGTLPSREEVEEFLADEAPDKRQRLVDRLLESESFVDYWTFRFATLLQVRVLPREREGTRVYHEWLRRRIRDGAPLDEIAGELLTATGDSQVVGPANFARMAPDARAHAELVSHAFMGARLECANCHDHPLDRWTQDDYHGLAAVFARLERGRHVAVSARGAVTNLRTGEPAVPRLPSTSNLAPDKDNREAFADWLTSPENPYFARSLVNRLWQAMFGRGLVEPVDDLRSTNPATHPELLDRLAADFVKHGYDLRHTLRLVAMSETYGRGDGGTELAVEANGALAADDRFYSRAIRRPLAPEVLADAIADVTGVSDRYGNEPLGTRAVSLFDPATPAASLDILGRCSRVAACDGDTARGGLPAKLHQLNGELVNRKIGDSESRLHHRIAAGWSSDAIVEDFYLRALSRPPRPAEREYWHAELANAGEGDRTQRLEDFVWSLLNSREFTSNH